MLFMNSKRTVIRKFNILAFREHSQKCWRVDEKIGGMFNSLQEGGYLRKKEENVKNN